MDLFSYNFVKFIFLLFFLPFLHKISVSINESSTASSCRFWHSSSDRRSNLLVLLVMTLLFAALAPFSRMWSLLLALRIKAETSIGQ